MRDFIIDQRHDFFAQAKRAHRQKLQFRRRDIAGDIIENLPRIMPDARVGGEEADVGIDLRRDGVVIAGAQMAIGPKSIRLAPHDQRNFGVGFHVDKAVDDLNA